ncbi:uncharacterized protein LOC118797947 [Colossoma macropomum]|uniref:uncharacterized protein LOC118797947 n=1 Tax=Colossoma macropomum TaxID=42526 RepID=UPI0018645395|nr:uncharacterized protein LOC118797947 [Colossoma macropomum]
MPLVAVVVLLLSLTANILLPLSLTAFVCETRALPSHPLLQLSLVPVGRVTGVTVVLLIAIITTANLTLEQLKGAKYFTKLDLKSTYNLIRIKEEDELTTTSNDPCNKYTPLDQPWRATNTTGLNICDNYFNWNGWYRLLYYGMSVRMPDSYVNQSRCANTPKNTMSNPCIFYRILKHDWRKTDSLYFSYFDDTLLEWSGWYRLYLQGKNAQIPEFKWCWSSMTCGGYTALFLKGSHPRPKNGIVTREIFGYHGSVKDPSQCNSYRSNPIQVKACPGNYYVYRLVKPPVSIPLPTYCAVTLDAPSYDPCNNYTSLDQPWRGANETGGYNSDRNFNWTGWYRLLYKGKSVRMAESCVNQSRCGTYYTLWLNGPHPQIEDGIVTRKVCGSSGSYCCYYRSTPVRVKACPGNYYVYEFVRPSFFYAAYCAVTTTLNDPCNKYTPLDQPWRATNTTGLNICDNYFNWNGWYRLLYYGMSVRMPDSCVNQSRCGTDITLWLNGSHPQIEDGIVTRGVCGRCEHHHSEHPSDYIQHCTVSYKH